MGGISINRGKFSFLFGVLFVKIPCCDQELSPFNLWGGKARLSILNQDVVLIDSVPQVVEAACHHSNAQTNKPTKHDCRVVPLISPLHNADKASADPPIG